MRKYSIRGYWRLLGLLARHMWAFLYLLCYSLIYGVTSLSSYIFSSLVRFVTRFPKTFIVIVCVAFVLDHISMMVHYTMKAQKQNIRFDSLALMKDSIENHSTFESGYSKGLVDGNNLITDNNGYKQKESAIPAVRRADSIRKDTTGGRNGLPREERNRGKNQENKDSAGGNHLQERLSVQPE